MSEQAPISFGEWQDLRLDLDRARALMVDLLKNVAVRRSNCRLCQKPLVWVTHANGKITPYTPEGLNHFIDCQYADEFRKKKENQHAGTGSTERR